MSSDQLIFFTWDFYDWVLKSVSFFVLDFHEKSCQECVMSVWPTTWLSVVKTGWLFSPRPLKLECQHDRYQNTQTTSCICTAVTCFVVVLRYKIVLTASFDIDGPSQMRKKWGEHVHKEWQCEPVCVCMHIIIIIIIIMYIYCMLINTLSAHIIHINLSALTEYILT